MLLRPQEEKHHGKSTPNTRFNQGVNKNLWLSATVLPIPTYRAQYTIINNNTWLVVLTILKNMSQWEGLSHILWKIKNVWNHQPAIIINNTLTQPTCFLTTCHVNHVNVSWTFFGFSPPVKFNGSSTVKFYGSFYTWLSSIYGSIFVPCPICCSW